MFARSYILGYSRPMNDLRASTLRFRCTTRELAIARAVAAAHRRPLSEVLRELVLAEHRVLHPEASAVAPRIMAT